VIVFGGRPGSGKSSIARAVVKETGALWLRIDSIEQAIRESALTPQSVEDAGYCAAYAVAEDNLRLGRNVIADSVNACALTRNAWRDVGLRSGAQVIEVETVCADAREHRRRIETRESEVPGLALPDWRAVIGRDYERWERERLTIDGVPRHRRMREPGPGGCRRRASAGAARPWSRSRISQPPAVKVAAQVRPFAPPPFGRRHEPQPRSIADIFRLHESVRWKDGVGLRY